MIAFLMGLPTVSPRELEKLLRDGQATAIDVNSPASWAQAHVPGALSLDPATFAASDLPADRAATLIFYCSNPLCRKAPIAARRAGKLGYTDSRVMSAGIKGWLGAGLAVESGRL